MFRRIVIPCVGLLAGLLMVQAGLADPRSPNRTVDSAHFRTPEEQRDLMQSKWQPLLLALHRNCLQCHTGKVIEERGRLGANTAWIASLRGHPQQPGPLPDSVTFQDMVDLVAFMGEHYGYYHIPDDQQDQYHEMLSTGRITQGRRF